jgi:hypothetical protein
MFMTCVYPPIGDSHWFLLLVACHQVGIVALKRRYVNRKCSVSLLGIILTNIYFTLAMKAGAISTESSSTNTSHTPTVLFRKTEVEIDSPEKNEKENLKKLKRENQALKDENVR